MKFSLAHWKNAAFGLALGLLPAACTAAGSSAPHEPSQDADDGADDGVVTPPQGACKVPDRALPLTRSWRLSPRQYRNTVERTFGVRLEAAGLPVDAPEGQGYAVFDTADAGKQVTIEHVTEFGSGAATVAQAILPDVQAQHGCLAEGRDDACIADFVNAHGRKAFRRPLTDEERTLYVDFFKTAAESWGGADAARLVLEGMLQSPRHLYRSELGVGDGARVGLTQYEIAAQLSYMLADLPPDDELMHAADDGTLKDAAEVRRHAERLLASPEGQRKLRDFFMQLLKVDDLQSGAVAKDSQAFPAFNPALRAAMVREAELFIDAVLADDAGSLRALHTADFSFANEALADLYGVGGPTGDAFDRIALPSERRGVLSQAAFLTLTSPPDHTSPAIRGITLWAKLLCRPIPQPPPGAADLANGKVFSPEPELTQREHWQFALANAPECTGCHGQFVPFGLGLEHFDAIGRHRSEQYGKPLDTRIDVNGVEGLEGEYPDTLAFVAKLIESDEGRRCAALQLETFAFGREIDSEEERCELDNLAERLGKNELRLADLALDLTQTASFYNRRTGP